MDVILDVDPGVDDALAILLALSSRELDVRALTVVSGNVPLASGAENALRILAFANRSDIPVYSGAGAPLERPPVFAKEIHGESGLGNAELGPSDCNAHPDAVGYLCESLESCPGEISIFAVGPLTNLALAERRIPGTLARAREIVVMGGAVSASGNASPVAEFNFFADPDAAREVIRSAANVTVIPLDVTREVGISEGEIESDIRPAKRPNCVFFEKVTEVVVQYGKLNGGYAGLHLHDPTAVAYGLQPDLFSVEGILVDVEVAGHLTSGQLVTDRRVGVRAGKQRGTRTRVAMGVDAGAVLELFRERVLRA